MTWIIASLLAALLQTIRTALQKHLITSLSTNAINWVRYSFGMPIILVYIFALYSYAGYSLPSIHKWFLIYCFGTAITQILGTNLLIMLFSRRNFSVGTTYAKTESLQTALLGFWLFGEALSWLSSLSIILGVVGILLVSMTGNNITPKSLMKSLWSKTALIGLASGAAFGFVGVLSRQAAISLDQDPLMNAAFTLGVVMTMQFICLGAWMWWQRPACFRDIALKWPACTLVGLTSVLGSIGWFTGFALANAAYVKTVGQVELLFSLVITRYVFKEQISRYEAIGMALVVGSILLLIYSVA